ncbi:MAG: hypothetical protein Q8K51_08300 [Nitrospirota bacterium]|nr:hypothetical protein [Nitrospirota bacterium]
MEIAEKANGPIQQPVSFSYIWGDALEELERVAPNLCALGKGSVASAVARIMCQGSWSKSVKKFRYEGVQDCRAAILAGGGDKACRYGCLGYGICTARCPVQAIDGTFNASEVFAAAAEKKKSEAA